MDQPQNTTWQKDGPLQDTLLITLAPSLLLKLQSQLSLAPSLLLKLQVNHEIHKWAPNQDITKGLRLIGKQQFAMHVGPGPMDHDSTTLPSTDKSHYLLPSQVLPSLWIHFHTRSTYARHLSKTKATFLFFSSYLLLYLLCNIYFILIFSERRDNT